MSLNDIRLKINRLDQKIVSLIAKRMELAKKAGILKKCEKVSIQDKQREKEILGIVKDKAMQEGVNPAMIEKVWKILINEAKTIQKNE